MLPGGRGTHRRTSTTGGSWAKQAELANAYSALAAELTRTEIKNLGGYSLGRVIGEGSFGKVRLGVHRLTGTRVAVKQVPKSLPGGSSSDPSSPLSLLTRELHHHRRLRHPHLLTLYELLATESSIYLVTELCAGGELFDYLVEHGRLSLTETRRIFGQLCLGVAYLHGEGVVHRDLKLENVLLDEEVNVKIADLGFARETEGGGGKWLETKVGTVGYSAPELIRGEKYLGEQIDVWSLGIILYALVTGSLPFDDDDEQVMRDLILKGEYEMPSWLDPDVSALIRLILVPNPSQRPSLHAILSHPFFTRSADPVSSMPIPRSPAASVASAEGFANSALQGSALSSSSSLVSMAALGREAGNYPPPIPEDGSPSLPSALMSEVKAGKQRAVQDDTEDEDAGERSDTLSSSLPVPSPFRPRRPSSSSVDFVAPPLQRTTSAGGASIVSTHSHNLTPHTPHARTPSRTKRRSIGSIISERLVSLNEDVEGGVHSSSPSPAPPPPAPRVDYLSLLTIPRQPPLSTPEEKALLDSLSALGMDAGQVAHSVRTHACDSCSAIWWMLKRKADEKELERLRAEEMEAIEAGGMGGGGISRTSSLRSLRGGYGGVTRRGSMRGREVPLPEEEGGAEELTRSSQPPPSPLRVEEYPLLPPVPSERPRRPRTPSPPTTTAPLPPPVGTPQTPSSHTRRPSAAPSTPSSSRRPSAAPSTPSVAVNAAPSSDSASTNSAEQEDPDARLDQFLQYPPGSQSAPLLSYFPTIVDPASPSRNRTMPRSKSKDHLSSQPVVSPMPSPGMGATPTSPSPQILPLGSPLSPGSENGTEDGARRSRNRAGSTSQLLARATSALGTSLSLIKASGGSEAGTPGTPGGAEEDPFVASGGGGKGMFAPRKSSLPSDDPRLINSKPTSSPPIPSAASLPSSPTKQQHSNAPLPATPPRPHLPPLSSSTAASAQASPSHPAPPTPRSAPTTAIVSGPSTPSPSLSAAASHETFATTASSSKSSDRPPAPTRPMSLGSLSGLGGSGSSNGGGKKSLKGANLLNTFKHWFGDGQRKRKRASMMPRLGASDPGGIPQIGSSNYNAAATAAGLARSQSLYVGSPLRRPPMGSRRSSNQSLAAAASAQAGGGALSRRSSVSSAHRAQIDFTPGRPNLGHHRRPSSDSRASFTSERDHSRPASLRSFSGQPGSAARKRHSKAASSSSTGSHATSMGKEAIYRRPPTTTTVRRRQGSHGRYGSHSHGHRRSASGATSTSHRSSLSDADASGSAAEDDGGFEDEPLGGAAVIEEEDEGVPEDEGAEAVAVDANEEDEEKKTAARARALRTLSGEITTPPHLSSSKPNSVHSGTSSHHYSARPYHPSTFTAHKSTHLFGSPSQPHAPPTSSSLARRAPPPPRPPLRDVFASVRSPENEHGEWIDEDDELAGYGGGLGQGRAETGGPAGGSSSSSAGAGLGLSSGGMDISTAAFADSPVAERVWGGGAGKFASRYAGVDAGVGGGGGAGGRAAPISRPAALIEEEEEEEEE